jgi:hypothetical protein
MLGRQERFHAACATHHLSVPLAAGK